MWVLGTSQHCFYNIMFLWCRRGKTLNSYDAPFLKTNVNVSAFFFLERPLVQAIFVQFH